MTLEAALADNTATMKVLIATLASAGGIAIAGAATTATPDAKADKPAKETKADKPAKETKADKPTKDTGPAVGSFEELQAAVAAAVAIDKDKVKAIFKEYGVKSSQAVHDHADRNAALKKIVAVVTGEEDDDIEI